MKKDYLMMGSFILLLFGRNGLSILRGAATGSITCGMYSCSRHGSTGTARGSNRGRFMGDERALASQDSRKTPSLPHSRGIPLLEACQPVQLGRHGGAGLCL